MLGLRAEIIHRVEKKLPLYECVFIARQDLTSAQVETLSTQLEKIVADNGGSISKRESWGLRSLAYKIKKNRKGHYVLFNIEGPASAVHEMERQMRINEDVLRYLTISVTEHENEPSIIMRDKAQDGTRDQESKYSGPGEDTVPSNQTNQAIPVKVEVQAQAESETPT